MAKLQKKHHKSGGVRSWLKFNWKLMIFIYWMSFVLVFNKKNCAFIHMTAGLTSLMEKTLVLACYMTDCDVANLKTRSRMTFEIYGGEEDNLWAMTMASKNWDYSPWVIFYETWQYKSPSTFVTVYEKQKLGWTLHSPFVLHAWSGMTWQNFLLKKPQQASQMNYY